MTGSSSGSGADLGQTASHQDFMLWWERQLAWVQYLPIIASCMFGELQIVYEGFLFVLGALLAFMDVVDMMG